MTSHIINPQTATRKLYKEIEIFQRSGLKSSIEHSYPGAQPHKANLEEMPTLILYGLTSSTKT